jgi:hypothetical protein
MSFEAMVGGDLMMFWGAALLFWIRSCTRKEVEVAAEVQRGKVQSTESCFSVRAYSHARKVRP